MNYLLRGNLFWINVQLQSQNNISDLLIKICKKYQKNNILHSQIF